LSNGVQQFEGNEARKIQGDFFGLFYVVMAIPLKPRRGVAALPVSKNPKKI